MQTSTMLTLQITLVGMGLVFATLIMLAGFLALLVRFTTRTDKRLTEADQAELERRRQAAIAAVVAALAQEESMAAPRFPMPPTALVSAWQAVLRSNMLNKRGAVR